MKLTVTTTTTVTATTTEGATTTTTLNNATNVEYKTRNAKYSSLFRFFVYLQKKQKNNVFQGRNKAWKQTG